MAAKDLPFVATIDTALGLRIKKFFISMHINREIQRRRMVEYRAAYMGTTHFFKRQWDT